MTASAIPENLSRVRERMEIAAARVGRAVEEITLVAVSKTFPAEAIRTAYAAGVRDFGENRIQEWEAKHTSLADLHATWHMIGHLQGNKARRAAEMFARVDSVDRWSIAEKLDRAIAQGARSGPLPVLIEVNVGSENSKSGVPKAELVQLAQHVAQKCTHLELCGLMAIPPYAEDAGQSRPYFRRLRELRDELRRKLGHDSPVLSMGMSHDFEVAIEEGATEVRIGTAIFGERPKTGD